MLKIIAAFDGLKFSESTKQYAFNLTKKTQSHLTGVFLDDRSYTSYKVYDLVFDQGVSEEKLKLLRKNDELKRKKSADIFDLDSKKVGVNYNIHHDKNVAIQDLLHESVFADLLIINFTESFTHYQEEYPTRFVRDLLSNTQCPVLLVPSTYKAFDKLIFLYDGTPTSVYALKMFNYLFSNFNNLPIEVISIRSMESSLHLPDHKLIKELINRHFSNATFTILKGLPDEEIVQHLKAQQNTSLAILGAYRRTMLSRWFKSSMADTLIKKLDLPLFIAHNK